MMPIYIIGISMEGCVMRIEGSNNNYAERPVPEEIQVNRPAPEVKVIERPVEEVQKKKISEDNFAKQITSATQGETQLSEKILSEAIERANKAIVGTKREFQYKKHDIINAFTVKVINSETKEIVREIPPEKILDLVANLMELAGLLVDEKR